MRTIPESQVLKRLEAENPWWAEKATVHPVYDQYSPRAYLQLLRPLVLESGVRRAVLLMGPRRVGKTVLLHHMIAKLIEAEVEPRLICYVSVDHPIYNGLALEELLEHLNKASGVDHRASRSFIFFDEIQYLRDWELHLKALVDAYAKPRFVASGSAAAALRLKSNESGAGRFTDFLLPPLTFHEFLHLRQQSDLVVTTRVRDEPEPAERTYSFDAPDIQRLNASFLDYLNFGGYPEALFSMEIQADPGRFIKADIIDKVLLRDLPSLYGIQDIQELNYLFTTLAYNTANEVSLEELAQNSGVAKNTLKRYMEYLEAAFLIRTVHRIDRNGKRFRRANFFKTYLTNPSIRSALFAPISADDDNLGSLAETAIYAQWFHATSPLHYARWKNGEVDIVYLSKGKPKWAVEVKWSDRAVNDDRELRNVLEFCRANRLPHVSVTTRSQKARKKIGETKIEFIPSSLYCYIVGFNIVRSKRLLEMREPVEQPRLNPG